MILPQKSPRLDDDSDIFSTPSPQHRKDSRFRHFWFRLLYRSKFFSGYSKRKESVTLPDERVSWKREHSKVSFEGTLEHADFDEEDDVFAPDGGWGWMVVMGSCIVSVLVGSLVSSFGVFYVELRDVLNVGSMAASWIPALFTSLWSLIAPFSNGLTFVYSQRRIAMIGVVISSIGVLLSSFANRIEYLYISYGILGGCGAGLCMPVSLMMVHQYFYKRRGLASGLYSVGSSIANAGMPNLVQYLIFRYNYNGALMVLSAVVLNGCVGACFFQPLRWHTPVKSLAVYPRRVRSESNLLSLRPIKVRTEPIIRHKKSHGMNHTYHDSNSGGAEMDKSWRNPSTEQLCKQNYRYILKGLSKSLEILPRIPEESETDEETQTNKTKSQSDMNKRSYTVDYGVRERAKPTLLSRTSDQLLETTKPYLTTRFVIHPIDYLTNSNYDLVTPLGSSQIVYYCPDFRYSEDDFAVTKLFHKFLCFKCPLIKQIFQVRIMSRRIFWIATFASISNRIVYGNAILLLPAYAQTLHISKQESAILLSIVSLTDVCFKFIIAWLSDFKVVPTKYFYIFGGLITSFTTAGLTMVTNFQTAVLIAIMYGASVGTSSAVQVVLLAEKIGVASLPAAYGLGLAVNGVAQIIAYPSIGLVNDMTGEYFYCWIILCCIGLMNPILWILETRIVHCNQYDTQD